MAFIVETSINATIDIAHFIVIGGVRVATRVVTSAIAAVAGPIAIISQIATFLLPWTGKVEASPIPISKGVGTGVPGTFLLTITSIGSNLNWPPALAACAHAFDIPLPALTPSDANVHWDISNQDPAGLIIRGRDTGSLDKSGKATLRFETTTESADLASRGIAELGVVDALVTLHRSDLDRLADRLADAALRVLPAAVQKVVSPTVHAFIDPLINGVKAKIATVRDIQTTGIEVVRYHSPREPKEHPPGQTTKGTGFSLMTGIPTLSVACTGPGQVCSSLEAAARQVVGSSHIRGRTCAGRIESTWSGAVASGLAGLPPAPMSFTVPATGKAVPWTAPALNQDYGAGSTISGHASVTREGERRVVFRIHLILDIRTALKEPLHEVEDAVWTGTIVRTSC